MANPSIHAISLCSSSVAIEIAIDMNAATIKVMSVISFKASQKSSKIPWGSSCSIFAVPNNVLLVSTEFGSIPFSTSEFNPPIMKSIPNIYVNMDFGDIFYM